MGHELGERRLAALLVKVGPVEHTVVDDLLVGDLDLVGLDERLELARLQLIELVAVLHNLREMLVDVLLRGALEVDAVVQLGKGAYAKAVVRIELVFEELFAAGSYL